MSETSLCPCCEMNFTPSVSLEAAVEDSIQNMFNCPHCQSVLKWEKEQIKIIRKSDPEDPKSLDLPKTNKEIKEEEKQRPGEVHKKPRQKEPLETQPAEPSAVNSAEELKDPNDTSIAEPQQKEPLETQPDEPSALNPAEELKDLNDTPIAEPQQEEPLETQPAEPSAVNSAEELKDLNDTPIAKPQQEEPPTAKPIEEPQETDLVNTDTPENFSDIEDYGSSKESPHKGLLRYELTIKGLDSSELEQKIFNILEDPRFNWSAKEILAQQESGILKLKDLNPVKAMTLILKLSELPFELSWKQYTIINTQNKTTDEEQDLQNN